jgi:hypothetical protein
VPGRLTRLALPAAAGVVLLGLAGTAHATGLVSLPLLDMDKEGTVPQAYSGLLLLAGAAAAYVAARRGAPARTALLTLAAVLAFMSLDEVFRLHEELDAALDFDWQVLYLPVLAAAFAGWVGIERSLRGEARLRLAWAAGAACWVVAQVLEAFQWDGRVRPGSIDGEALSEAQVERLLGEPAYLAKMLPEEILEMSGSLILAVVLARLAERALAERALATRASATSPRRSAPAPGPR